MIVLKIIFYIFLSLAGIFLLILLIPKIGNKYLRRKQQENNDAIKKRLPQQIGEPVGFNTALDFDTLQQFKKLILAINIPHMEIITAITQYPTSDLWVHTAFSYHDDLVASYALITPEMSRKLMMQLLLVWDEGKKEITLYASEIKDEYTDNLRLKFREEIVRIATVLNQNPE